MEIRRIEPLREWELLKIAKDLYEEDPTNYYRHLWDRYGVSPSDTHHYLIGMHEYCRAFGLIIKNPADAVVNEDKAAYEGWRKYKIEQAKRWMNRAASPRRSRRKPRNSYMDNRNRI